MANRRHGPPGGKWTKGEAAKRAQLGWELRVGGASWDTVAEEAGYQSASTACRAVTRFAGGLPAVDLDEMRRAAIERGLWLLRKAAEDVEAGKPGAITHMVRAETRFASLLGLDATRELILHTPTHAELERWVAGVLSQVVPDVVEADVVGGDYELEPVPPGELAAAE